MVFDVSFGADFKKQRAAVAFVRCLTTVKHASCHYVRALTRALYVKTLTLAHTRAHTIERRVGESALAETATVLPTESCVKISWEKKLKAANDHGGRDGFNTREHTHVRRQASCLEHDNDVAVVELQSD